MLWDYVGLANRTVDAEQPWSLAKAAKAGDEAAVVVRLTPWEIAPAQPMSEVFLAVRRCNAVAHVLLAVMPEFEPVTQATRYARLMLDRLGT